MNLPPPNWLMPLAIPASWAYGRAVARRNARFDRGDGVTRLDRPVISVGNITVGGTGKTPMVAAIVTMLRESGRQPMIAMRGYGAAPGGVSDEAEEYRERLGDVPIVAQPDRIAGIRAALETHPGIDCIVLDDGFQHRQIHRDLDLVLIDATAGTFDDRLLPAGRLREPLENLTRADGVIVTRAEQVDQRLVQQVVRLHGREPLAWTRHSWKHLVIHNSQGERWESPQWLRGRRVAALLGVGHPRSIRSQLEAAGASVELDITAGDHQRYDRRFVSRIETACGRVEALITTGKDWVKLRTLLDLRKLECPVVIPVLEIGFLEGLDAVRELLVGKVAGFSGAARGKPRR